MTTFTDINTTEIVPQFVSDDLTLTEFLPSEILDLAADLIESAGWTQGSGCRGRKYCAAGAVAQLAVGNPESMWVEDVPEGSVPDSPQLRRSLAILASVMPVQYSVDAASIFVFNDDDDTTQADVIQKMRQAADLARQSGE